MTFSFFSKSLVVDQRCHSGARGFSKTKLVQTLGWFITNSRLGNRVVRIVLKPRRSKRLRVDLQKV
jgi:hypothetical protein